MLSIHLLSYITLSNQSITVINHSIHINLSAGAQNITGAYILIRLVKLFVQGYNLEVHNNYNKVDNKVDAKTLGHCNLRASQFFV